jgi:hypothetical protein
MCAFKIPKFELVPKRQVELEFNGPVPTLGYLVLSGGPITYPFRILSAKLYFDQEANNLVEYRLYVAESSGVSPGYWPSDFNLLGGINPSGGYRGRSIVKEINTVAEVKETNRYIKFAAYNGNPYAYWATASVVIQEI